MLQSTLSFPLDTRTLKKTGDLHKKSSSVPSQFSRKGTRRTCETGEVWACSDRAKEWRLVKVLKMKMMN